MGRWDGVVTETAEDAKSFWAEAPLDTLNQMMAPRWAWEEWLKVAAAGVIAGPGTVFEPGCGIGLLAGLLPPGSTYYGCDINPAYILEARRSHDRPGVRFEQRDLEDVLDSGERYDWVVVTSLFGMFPEAAAYELLPRFWQTAARGMSITTVNKRLFSRHRLLRFDFSTHDPDELVAAARDLPGAADVQLHHGREYPQFRGQYWQRCLALYVWRTPGGQTGE